MDDKLRFKHFKEREKVLTERLKEKRLSLGQADGPMFSRFPTGRAELEQDIQVLENILADIRKEIDHLEKVKSSRP